MTRRSSREASWEIAGDALEVHALLCACDAFVARPGVPAPLRNANTTAIRVAGGAVHLLRSQGTAIAAFTFTLEPPFQDTCAKWPPARRPAYVSRVTVHPSHLASGTLLGLRCFRKAFELAAAHDADVLRVEANPDLGRVGELLRRLGFGCFGERRGDDGLRRAYYQKTFGRLD